LTPEQELYALPPDRFIAARDEAVAQARSAGDRAAAASLAKLRRPTVAAWLVNLLALRRPEQVGELLDLAAAMREAQHGLRGEELRHLSTRRREAIAGLVGQVRGLAVEAGRPARETLPLAEVEATLTAALADEEVAAAVRAGRLTKATGYAGFGEVPDESAKPRLRVIDGDARGAGASQRSAAGDASRVEPSRAAQSGAERSRAERAAREEERRAAEKAAQAARTQARRQAEADLRQATADQERAAREVADLTEQLAQLRERQAAAEVALRETKLRRKAAQRALDRLG
jgi:hypothetical protein